MSSSPCGFLSLHLESIRLVSTLERPCHGLMSCSDSGIRTFLSSRLAARFRWVMPLGIDAYTAQSRAWRPLQGTCHHDQPGNRPPTPRSCDRVRWLWISLHLTPRLLEGVVLPYSSRRGRSGGILVTRSLYRDGVRAPRSIDYVES